MRPKPAKSSQTGTCAGIDVFFRSPRHLKKHDRRRPQGGRFSNRSLIPASRACAPSPHAAQEPPRHAPIGCRLHRFAAMSSGPSTASATLIVAFPDRRPGAGTGMDGTRDDSPPDNTGRANKRARNAFKRNLSSGAPRPCYVNRMSRQVSWLSGRRPAPAFPAASRPVARRGEDSPMTVAGAAPEFVRAARHRIPY